MTTVFLVRHGEVEGNRSADRRFVGWSDIRLTPHGELQATAVARRLKPERLVAIYSSDLQRASQTARMIADEQGIALVPSEELREACYGEWEGLGEADIRKRWPDLWQQRLADPVTCGPPQGETLEVVRTRVTAMWQHIVGQHAHEAVAIVSHNTALRVLLCDLLGSPTRNYRRLQVDNGSIARLEVSAPAAEPPVLVSYLNDTAHLIDEVRTR